MSAGVFVRVPTPPLLTAAAAVAVEELAHRWYATSNAPAAAVMAVALCGARLLAVTRVNFDAADRFLQHAPLNVATLALHNSLRPDQLELLCDTVAACGCHGLMRELMWQSKFLHLPGDTGRETGFAALRAACGGLRHVRALSGSGPGVVALLDELAGQLRRVSCGNTAVIDARFAMLRHIGRDGYRRSTLVSIDLSAVPLRGVGDDFARDASALRALRLPASVTAIGSHVLADCLAFTGVLDLTELPKLRRIGSHFAERSAVSAVRLPSAVTTIGSAFLAGSQVTEVRLPSSVTALGSLFASWCIQLTGTLDVSNLRQLAAIPASFAQHTGIAAVLLPTNATSIGEGFLFSCELLTGVLDLSALTQLRDIGAVFASGSRLSNVRLPPSVTAIGPRFVDNCPERGDVDVSHLTQLRDGREQFEPTELDSNQ
jgi:hypothetical protein